MKDPSGSNMSRRTALRGIGAALGSSAMARVMAAEKEGQPVAKPLRIPAWYYQHFDADHDLDVPEEAFGGWKREALEFSRGHTAVVVMHAWEAGRSKDDFPGWWRIVPYIPRGNTVLQKVFPGLLTAVRASELPLFHVVGGGDYYKDLPGYRHARGLAAPTPPDPEKAASDPIRDRLYQFKRENAYQGLHNEPDVQRGFAKLGFAKEARPQDGEGIAENAAQLFALCKERGINHLIYCGFAINWCLLLSPGGMADMQKHGLMCSALRQATVAVENKQSAREQLCKEFALWRVALAFGFVFDVDDFVASIGK